MKPKNLLTSGPVRRHPAPVTHGLRARRRGFNLLEVMICTFLLGMATIAFAALYPPASKCSHMSGNYSQAISAVQHKVDELRSVGYGRLTYADLKSAGVIDDSPSTSPYHFETKDGLGTLLPNAVGTVTLSSAGTNLTQAVVKVTWAGQPAKAMGGSHEVTVLIANVN